MGNDILVHIAQVIACSLEVKDRRYGGPTVCGKRGYERAGEGPDKVTLVPGYRWCKNCIRKYGNNDPKWGNIPEEVRIVAPWMET